MITEIHGLTLASERSFCGVEMEVCAGMKEGRRQVVLAGGRKPGVKWRQMRYLEPLTGGNYSGARAYRSSKTSFKFLQVAGRGGLLYSPPLWQCWQRRKLHAKKIFTCYRKKENMRLGQLFLAWLVAWHCLSPLPYHHMNSKAKWNILALVPLSSSCLPKVKVVCTEASGGKQSFTSSRKECSIMRACLLFTSHFHELQSQSTFRIPMKLKCYLG